MERHFDSFRQVYPQRFAANTASGDRSSSERRPAFLRCGDLAEGFARVRCPDCRHEFFVAFSCKQRCACPSCHQKRGCSPLATWPRKSVFPSRTGKWC